MTRSPESYARLRPPPAVTRVIRALELSPMTTADLGRRLNLSRRGIEDSLRFLRGISAVHADGHVRMPSHCLAKLWRLQRPVPSGGAHV